LQPVRKTPRIVVRDGSASLGFLGASDQALCWPVAVSTPLRGEKAEAYIPWQEVSIRYGFWFKPIRCILEARKEYGAELKAAPPGFFLGVEFKKFLLQVLPEQLTASISFITSTLIYIAKNLILNFKFFLLVFNNLYNF